MWHKVLASSPIYGGYLTCYTRCGGEYDDLYMNIALISYKCNTRLANQCTDHVLPIKIMIQKLGDSAIAKRLPPWICSCCWRWYSGILQRIHYWVSPCTPKEEVEYYDVISWVIAAKPEHTQFDPVRGLMDEMMKIARLSHWSLETQNKIPIESVFLLNSFCFQ
jgi:hypothetical protein